MSWHATSSVDEAIEETRSFLPSFEIGPWLKLALISIFVGVGGSGFTSFFNIPSAIPSDSSEFGESAEEVGGPAEEFVPPTTDEVVSAAASEIGLIIAVAVGLLAIALFFGIITETLRFVFYQALHTDEIVLIEPAKARFEQALRLLGFKIGIQLLAYLPFILVGIVLLSRGIPEFTTATTIAAAIGVVVAIVWLLVFMAISRATDEFVVPTMVITDSNVLDGWRRFWPVLRGQLSQFGVYLVVHFLLVLAVGIGQTIISLLVYGIVITIGAVIGLVIVFGIFGGIEAIGTAGIVLLVVLAILTLGLGWALLLPVQIVVLTFVVNYEVSMLGAADEELRLRPERSATDDPAAVVE